MVQLLLSKGSSVCARDHQGHTPALACAPSDAVADCLAMILLQMYPAQQPPPPPGNSRDKKEKTVNSNTITLSKYNTITLLPCLTKK